MLNINYYALSQEIVVIQGLGVQLEVADKQTIKFILLLMIAAACM